MILNALFACKSETLKNYVRGNYHTSSITPPAAEELSKAIEKGYCSKHHIIKNILAGTRKSATAKGKRLV